MPTALQLASALCALVLVLVLAPLPIAAVTLVSTAWPCADAAPITYPIPGTPVADYDVNCNWNVSYTPGYWYPRALNMSQWNNVTLPASVRATQANVSAFVPSARTVDTTRLNYRLIVSGGRQLLLPINLRPSALPNCTVEYLVSVGSVPNSNWRALWSTDLASNAPLTNVAHGRSLLVYEATGSGSGFVPIGPSAMSGLRTGYGSGFAHVAITYTNAANLVQWTINGRFSQNRTAAQAEGDSVITLGGVNGISQYNVNSQTIVFMRVWDRVLNASEILLLSDSGMYPYARPIISNPYPFAIFNPTPGGTGTVSAAAIVQNPTYTITQYNCTMLCSNASVGQLWATGTTSAVSNAVSGNATYTTQFFVSIYPSTSYYSHPHRTHTASRRAICSCATLPRRSLAADAPVAVCAPLLCTLCAQPTTAPTRRCRSTGAAQPPACRCTQAAPPPRPSSRPPRQKPSRRRTAWLASACS